MFNQSLFNIDVFNSNAESGSSLTAALAKHDVFYSSLSTARSINSLYYCSLSQKLHSVSYQSESIFHWHESRWSIESQLLHQAIYQSETTTLAAILHTHLYASTVSVFTQHDVHYRSLEGVSQVWMEHTHYWESATQHRVLRLHNAGYASLGGTASASQRHTISYASWGVLSQVFTLHETSWTVTPDIRQLHITSWKSVTAANQLHAARWASTADNFSLHETRYRSSHSTPILQDGLIYVRV